MTVMGATQTETCVYVDSDGVDGVNSRDPLIGTRTFTLAVIRPWQHCRFTTLLRRSYFENQKTED